MAIQERDLNWYLENEQEPTDEESAELSLNGFVEVDDGQPVTDPPVEEEPAPAATATTDDPDDKEPSSTTDTPDNKDDDSGAKGVLSADGETVIPYKVLRGSRDQVAELQSQNSDLQQQLTDAQTRLEAGTPAGEETEEVVATGEITDAVVETEFERIHGKTLEEFREEYGEEQANLFLAPVRENLATKQELSAIRQSLNAREADEETAVKTSVQEAIDANATLVNWQQNDPVMWKAAVAVDEALQADEEWSAASGKSYEERFEEVVKRLGHAPEPEPSTTKTPEEIAADKIAAANKSATVPASLSEVPGGSPAAETLRDQAEGMSEGELTQAMIDNPKLQEELLASLS